MRARTLSGWVLSAVLLAPHTTWSQELESPEPPFAFGLESTLFSRYVFRGQALTRGAVSQSTLWASFGSVGVYAFSNVLLRDEPWQRRVSELDFGVSSTHELGALTLEPALDRYVFRMAGVDEPPTVEASVRLSYAFGALQVFAEPILDLERARGGFFFETGISRDRSLGDGFTVSAELRLALGSARYNAAYAFVSKRALHHAGVEVSLTHELARRLRVRYQVELTRVVDAELRRATDSPDVVRFGVAFEYDSY